MCTMDCITDDRLSSLRSLIAGASDILLVTHHHPDGDAIGSTVAMKHFLTDVCGRKASIIYPSPVPASLEFLVEGEAYSVFESDPERISADILGCGLMICLDFNKFSRTNGMEDVLACAGCPKVLVDHHLNPDVDAFDTVFSETGVSSTCELLYRVLLAMPETGGDAGALPAASARALMAGMTTDTNNFANSVFPGTLSMASELIAAGVDRDALIQEIYNNYRINRIRIFSHMLGSCLHTTAEGAAYMIVTKDIWNRFGCEEGETEGLVNVPLSVKGIRISLLLREDDGYFRVSVRSKRGTSAQQLAAGCFHGGGHEQASGGRLYFPEDIATPDDACGYVEKVTARFLQEQDSAKQDL